MFDFKQFCQDFNVPTYTQGSNCSPGWIQTRCMFCGDRSNHLGFNTYAGFLSCWKCGFHSNIEFVHSVINSDWTKAQYVLREYDTNVIPLKQKKTKVKHAKSLSLDFADKLSISHKQYLRNRKFNPDKIEKIWGIKGTQAYGEYKFRIIIPIFYNKKLISFTARDYTGKSELRYKTCSKEKEVLHHRNILYGIDKCTTRKCIVVEGPTDVWRLGPGAVATFSINYENSQLYLLAEKFSKVFIMFDEGDIAQQKANQLGIGLKMMGVDVERCIIKGDPGNLPQETADKYRKELLG